MCICMCMFIGKYLKLSSVSKSFYSLRGYKSVFYSEEIEQWGPEK